MKTRILADLQIFISAPLINLAENVEKALDDENIGRRVFQHLKKVFDTVDLQILLAELNPFKICGVSND